MIRVWIWKLLYKIHHADFDIRFTKLLHLYLNNRRIIKVTTNQETSSEKIIRAGDPQGSVLRPALFNFYIHDMPIFSKANLHIFADHTARTFLLCPRSTASNQIQQNMLNKYFEKWKLKLNETTDLIIFSRKRTEFLHFCNQSQQCASNYLFPLLY